MVWLKGQKLHGHRYVIERKLGQGGVGITYLAKDTKGNPLAIKTLTDEVMTNPDFIEFRDKYQRDFEREATRLAVCRHPHIVQIENVFREQSLPCIAMEYIQGEDLWQRVRNRHPLSEAEALGYIQQIGEALTLVHDKGLLHRDLKPHNIMVRSGVSEAVLIDFGIAREFIPNLTQTHTVNFTPGFAPLEQYDEQAHRGEYTDVYGLAATLYCLLTTKVPPPAFMRVVRDSLQPPQALNSNVSDRVNQGILTGMELQPEKRPQSVSEWLRLLIPQNSGDDLSVISFKQLAENNPEAELEMAAMEKRGKDKFLLRAATAPDANHSKLNAEYFKTYNQIKALAEAEVQALLAEKDSRISSLEGMVETVLQRPSFYTNTQVEQVGIMTNNPSGISQSNTGSMGGGQQLEKASKVAEAGTTLFTKVKPILVKVAGWLGAAAGSFLGTL